MTHSTTNLLDAVFQALEPDDTLQAQWHIGLQLRTLIEQHLLDYSPEGIRRWRDTGPVPASRATREEWITILRELLGSQKLPELESAFIHAYHRQLEHPRRRAAKMVLDAAINDGIDVSAFRWLWALRPS